MGSSVQAVQADAEVCASRRLLMAGAIITAMVTLAYLLLFWNRFAGLRSGSGEYAGGALFLAGLRPYRDYFVPATPFSILKSAAILSLFGKAAIVTRAFGVLERVVLGVMVYFWLARMFRVGHAVVAALATIIVSSGDTADPLASYNHDTILLAVAGGLFASAVLYRQRNTRSIALFAALSGVCAGLCFLTKQTIGALATLSIVAIISTWLLRQESARKAAAFVAGFSAGWAAVAVAVLLWLARLGILRDFFQQVFVQGPAAKSSHLADFLNREILVGVQWRLPVAAALATLLISWRVLHRSALKEGRRPESIRFLIGVLLLGLSSVAAGAIASYHALGPVGPAILKPVIYFTFFGSALQTVYYGILLLRGRLSRREAQFCMYAAISFAVAAMLSLSYPAFEAMIIPGLGLLVATLLDASTSWRIPVVYAVCALLIAAETCAKLNAPFGFATFGEPPVRTAQAVSGLPQLRGFILPEGTVRFIDDTVKIIQENSSPQDTIFIYPELGLLSRFPGAVVLPFRTPTTSM